MNLLTKNDIELDHIRPLFSRLNDYHNTASAEASKREYLHKWYFDLYETMYANGLKIGSNYFLSMFLQFTKNKNTTLHQELQKFSAHENIQCHNFFMDTQVDIRYLDYLLNNDFNLKAIEEEIEGLKLDMDSNNKYLVPTEKEERRIHIETIKLLESLLGEGKIEKNKAFPVHEYLSYEDLEEIREHIQSLTFEEEQLKICLSATAVDKAKDKVLENIERFKKIFRVKKSEIKGVVQGNKKKSFTRELFKKSLKQAFTVELYFKCYANEKSRSRLKTRAFSDKEKYTDIKEFSRDYFELTKGKKVTLSYIPLMIFGLDVGLNKKVIYTLCNQYYSYCYNSELNRKEFDKNITLFSCQASSRQQLDSFINDFTAENFEEIEYTAEASNEDTIKNAVYKEFHDFIIYYILSNQMNLVDNNIFLDDKVIEIEDASINDIISYFEPEEFGPGTDIVLTEDEAERIKKLFT